MRTALVTGGSRGIGRAIALRLSQEGWRPLIHYRAARDEAEAAAAACGGVAAPFGADLAEPEACERLWEWAIGQGPVNALVNNAGVYVPRGFLAEGAEAFENWLNGQMSINFVATARLSRSFAMEAILTGTRPARILNVCSRVGFRGEAGAAAYAASKAAQINLTRSLAVELAKSGIEVFGIAPGWVETAMTREGMEARRKEIEDSIPLGRVATPEDCAHVAAFLLSDEAAYLSGVVIDVNGASYFH
ncbi:MAG: 3-oxoacyl-[acyl-carrier-protein] reductase FabG [Fimbriimonadales bacterium]|nr:3-oxoacyl-[acyl-carrier-protein] reductase FabG [Fimbriimonadales bacterium]